MRVLFFFLMTVCALAGRPAGGLAQVEVRWPEVRQTAAPAAAVLYPRPVAMRLLLLSGDGSESSLKALQLGLNYLAIPYDTIVASRQPLPLLSENGKGRYQGIVLATGSLAYQADGVWKSALTTADWAQLDAYCRDFQVRTVSYYTFPEARYGMQLVNASSDPASVDFSVAAAEVFPELNRDNPLPLSGAYLYQAKAVPGNGEQTVPVLTINGNAAGVLHTAADGRQTLALTMDHNPALRHSMALLHGVIHWVTKGIFLGERRAYLTPQNDDLFLANRLFVASIPACRPTEFIIDQSSPDLLQCPALRITGADLESLRNWQRTLQADPQTAGFRVTHAFNGYGANAPGDSLVAEVLAGKDDFFWVNHTYDHKNLDCFATEAGKCRPANAIESNFEITENWKASDRLQLPVDRLSVVTPGISGLTNDQFLAAAAAQGVRYLVSDASRPEWLPAAPNTGLRANTESPLLIIPRRATSLFFHTADATPAAAGSQPDAYNYLYGPDGAFHVGGPDGPPFFAENQTYQAILNRESDALVTQMLRGDIYPYMFHQSNFWRYDSERSLFTDLIGQALQKFQRLSKMPVVSLSQAELGRLVDERMLFLASGVEATIEPEGTIAFEATAPANVPVTGICPTECESYGGQQIARIPVEPGRTVRVRWQL